MLNCWQAAADPKETFEIRSEIPVSAFGALAFLVFSGLIGTAIYYVSDLKWVTGTLLGAATLLLLGTFLAVDEPDQGDDYIKATRKIATINSASILVLLVIAAAIELPRHL